MRCRLVSEFVDRYLEGSLNSDELQLIDSHVASCAGCRMLLGSLRGEVDLLSREQRERMVQEVLRETSGLACARAQELLGERVDGELEPHASELLSLHLHHCQACAELAASLEELKECLSTMAEIEPDPQFVESVLCRISRRQLAAERSPRIHRWWAVLVRRPG